MTASGNNTTYPCALTIAGSDSGGGAGIQADLKTFAAYGVFGTTALTCLTAQNPDEVRAVEPVTSEMVRRQIQTVLDVFPVAAVKTGMLYSKEIIIAVAETLAGYPSVPLVVDPVMVSTSGAKLLRDDAIDSMINLLFPMACVVTPNLSEAELLTGKAITTVSGLRDAAEQIAAMAGGRCLVKGGHLADGAIVTDVLYAGGEWTEHCADRIEGLDTHGTGCTFAAAITACLAQGLTLQRAAGEAQAFVGRAMKNAPQVGCYHPLWPSIPPSGFPEEEAQDVQHSMDDC